LGDYALRIHLAHVTTKPLTGFATGRWRISTTATTPLLPMILKL